MRADGETEERVRERFGVSQSKGKQRAGREDHRPDAPVSGPKLNDGAEVTLNCVKLEDVTYTVTGEPGADP